MISALRLAPDPIVPSKTSLFVGGTTGNDTIFILPSSHNRVQVLIGAHSQGTFAPNGEIFVYGQAGNDTIEVLRGVQLPAILDGGAGNDFLIAKGGDVLLGGTGNDQLFGISGRNLLIGGTGGDKLFAGNGDILIAGTTTFDNNIQALHAIMTEWTSSHTYAARLTNLRGLGNTSRANGSTYLVVAAIGTTVFSDANVDTIFGSGGQDLFFAHKPGSTNDQVQKTVQTKLLTPSINVEGSSRK